MKYPFVLTVLCALSLTLFACSPAAAGTTPTAEATAVVEATATPRAAATPEPTATAEPTETPTPEPLTTADLFELLSPSVARVTVGNRFGSGVLLEDGYVLTNAHVAWPDETVKLIFPDGQEIEDVPVAGIDLVADMALLGPIETDLTPIAFDDVDTLRVGSEILLIGYPGDSSRAPRPTLTETLISRQRDQEQLGLTLFQVDSPVAGGQSGGIALTADGRIVGLTGNRITEAGFGLITAGADLLPRIERMRSATAVLPGRGPERDKANVRHFFRMDNNDEQRPFVVRVDDGTELELTLDSNNDAVLFVAGSSLSDVAFADDLKRGKESITLEVSETGVHSVVAGQMSAKTGTFTLVSNVPLTPYHDPDDGEQLSSGEVYEGAIDFAGDMDFFTFTLRDDQEINISASSLMIDPFISVRPINTGGESEVYDDDSGDGIVGGEAEMTYRAPHAGVYELRVSDALILGATGGYVVSLQEPYEGAPTAIAPKPTAEPIASDFGDMQQYESDLFGFRMQLPTTFTKQQGSDVCPSSYTVCYSDLTDPNFNFLAFIEAELGAPGAVTTLEEYVDALRAQLSSVARFEFVKREDVVTAQGDPAVILEFSTSGDQVRVRTFITFLRDDAVFVAMYYYALPEQAELGDYLFSTYER
jgi:hypothetical protein